MSGHVDHEAFAEALAIYALDALDSPGQRAALEAHLAECVTCRNELAMHRETAAAIGESVAPIVPPPELRERALAAAVQRSSRANVPAGGATAPAVELTHHRVHPQKLWTSASLAWLTTAAAVIVAAAALIYAYALQREVTALTQVATSAAARSNALAAEINALRQQSAELVRVLNVIGAPDVRLAALAGQGAADGALGRAYWSRSQGLVFRALQLPPLSPDRDYQLWIVPPAGAAPVSMGVITVRADGTSSHSTPLADLPAAAAVALTIEPAGGSATPTLPIVMVGNLIG
jgi:anti-sigma-K factor RskA